MKHIFISFLTLFIFISGSISAQTVESLQRSINKSRKEITYANRLLKSNTSKQSSKKKMLSLVNSKISNRRNIVRNLESQTKLLNGDIRKNEKQIVNLNIELSSLRDEYTTLMRFAYKNQLHNNIIYYIFSSSSFDDLHRRLYYLRCYSKMRILKSKEILATSEKITVKVNELNTQKSEAQMLKTQTATELKKFNKDKKSYNYMLRKLVSQHKNLNSTIRRERKKINRYEAHIKKIMAEEAKKVKKAKKTNTKAQSAEIIRLSGAFAQNKGKLPPPVANGTITERYGVHAHPLYPKIKVNNLGINYTIPNGENVRSVFDGVVSNIYVAQGLDNSIIIRHGEYFTVYTGLNVVNVKKGDKVKLGQVIGAVKSDDSYNIFNFAVWLGAKSLNPEYWLR